MPAFYYKRVLASFVTQTASTGKWHRVTNPNDVTHIPVNIDLTAGTGTVVIEGTNEDPNVSAPTAAVQILSATATGGQIVGWYPYMRAKVTGGSGLSAKVTLGVSIKQIEP